MGFLFFPRVLLSTWTALCTPLGEFLGAVSVVTVIPGISGRGYRLYLLLYEDGNMKTLASLGPLARTQTHVAGPLKTK